MISQEEKQSIFEAARATMLDWYGYELSQKGACIYWNQCAMRELYLRGHKPVLQAGDMLWRIVPTAQDDGTVATHFGYEWTPQDPFSQQAMTAGLLPEVHIWCGLLDTQDLVDFSTGTLPQVAKEQHGYDWHTDKPPEYVFGRPSDDAFYRPNIEATLYVYRFIMEKFTER